MNKEYNNINKNNVSSNITLDGTGLTWNYYESQAVLLDKYYKVNQKQARSEMPKNAQRDIINILDNKHEYKIQVTVDYLTIEIENDAPQALCHVVIKSLGYNTWTYPAAQQTILYNEGVKPGQPIETTGTPAPREGYYITCDGANDVSSNTTVNPDSYWDQFIKKNKDK